MKEKIENTVWLLLENVPAVLTVAFAAYVLLRSQSQTLSQLEVTLWILTILGLLATSELVERFRRLRRIETLARATFDAVKQISTPGEAKILKDRVAFEPLEKYAAEAKDIFAAGRSLVTLAGSRELLKERIERGCNLRFVVVDPNSPANQGMQTSLDTSVEALIADIMSALRHFQYLKSLPTVPGGGTIEVRLSDCIPTLSLLMIDGAQRHGKITVELLPYKCYTRARPHFELTAERDPHWYNVFRETCEKLWEESKLWQG